LLGYLVRLDPDRVVKGIIVEHYRENRGHVPAFAGITGYRLLLVAGYDRYDFGLPFSITGDRVGRMQKVERLRVGTLGTRRGDTRLTGLLKTPAIQVIRRK
jgi:hypothetical protein